MSKSKMTKIIGSLGILILLAVAWVAILSPRMGKAGEVNAQADSVNQSNGVLQHKVASLQAQAKNLGAETARAKEVAAAFPATADLNNLFAQITQAAQTAGISAQHVTSLTQGVPVIVAAGAGGVPAAGGGATLASSGTVKLASMPFTVSASGSPGQLLAFMHNLDSMPRSYLVSSAVLGSPAAGTSTVSLTGQLFVLSSTPPPVVNPDGSVTAVLPSAAPTPGIPAAPGTPAVPVTPPVK